MIRNRTAGPVVIMGAGGPVAVDAEEEQERSKRGESGRGVREREKGNWGLGGAGNYGCL